ncbi:MAG: glucose-6-phosphate isomerase [Candidatus Binatia bacterium]|nr:MAG: glucose-6-phosphate isomerase [Candidatus Binatia bacterium]
MAEVLGSGGVSSEALEELALRLGAIAKTLRLRRERGELGFWDLPYAKGARGEVERLAHELRGEAEVMVVLGIGGSALGTRTILHAVPGDRRVLVLDNLDPSTFGALLDELDLSRTVFDVVSKSGQTTETLAQFLVVRDRLLKTFGGVDYRRHLVVTTDPERGPLRQIARDEGLRALEIPPNVGGRFSVLSAVGLLPAAFAGLDVAELLRGAAEMEKRVREGDIRSNPAAWLAALLWAHHTRHGRRNVVFMPYSDRLRELTAWFVQLWSESLGKALDLEGRTVHFGQTPIPAVGATDQHSQLQLFTEGPDDKVFLMLRVEDHGRDFRIPVSYEDMEELAYLGGHTLGELLNMEEEATETALVAQGRPVVRISVPAVELHTLGQLFFLFEVAVTFVGGLADVDPFDQPGVEETKRLTFALAGRRGFEEKRAEMEEWRRKRDARYVV